MYRYIFMSFLEPELMLTYFFTALDKSQSKRDGGFKSSWSFDHSEESEGDTEKE